MDSKNTHKDAEGLVKEIFHDWEWGKDANFIHDVKTKSEQDFAIQFHDTVGMQIRNSYGLWKGDTDLYKWFIEKGITHADEMSHYIFVELYRYAKQQIA